ncbi:MAG TPA: hypothetical protein DCW90_13355 [Lachnospiraceae bacterium]|nr:hypothetical protein [Lachnospiraceae bacterium]
MYVITLKSDDSILGTGKKVEYLSNGYPRLVDGNIIYDVDSVNVYEVSSIPSGINVIQYCYTPSSGFYENPLWFDPENEIHIATQKRVDEAKTKVVSDFLANSF